MKTKFAVIVDNDKMGKCAKCKSAWCNSWACCQRCGHGEKEAVK